MKSHSFRFVPFSPAILAGTGIAMRTDRLMPGVARAF
jgi:hypothetical protein